FTRSSENGLAREESGKNSGLTLRLSELRHLGVIAHVRNPLRVDAQEHLERVPELRRAEAWLLAPTEN
ncbi:MAG TPA: hypothetical protein VML58_19280, partial [Burkholderiaceae bacterium]|nr:hypothetical protein [Burkholderiaceae bacterium]